MSTLQGVIQQQKRSSQGEGAANPQDVLSSCLPHLTTEFKEAADVFFELDSSFRCPAHSQLLSSYSEALCRALRGSPGNERVISLKGCDARDLVNILESIYSRGSRVKSVDAAVSLTKLASIYSDASLKAECDNFLNSCADRPCSLLSPKVCLSCWIHTVWSI